MPKLGANISRPIKIIIASYIEIFILVYYPENVINDHQIIIPMPPRNTITPNKRK